MALLSSRIIVNAVVARLQTTPGMVAYLSAGPQPPAGKTVVVHPVPGTPDGVLGDPDRNAMVEFQTTCIGATVEQVLWSHDQVVAHLSRQKLTGTGFITYPVRMLDGGAQPVRRDDTLATPMYLVTCSWLAVAQPN